MSPQTDSGLKLTVDAGLMDKIRDIVTRRNHIQELLRKAESNKQKVKPEIFKKVLSDYEEKMKSVAAEYEPVSADIVAVLREIRIVETDLRKQMAQNKDMLEELRFRCEVGEFSEEELNKMEAENVRKVEDLEGKLKIVDATYAECRNYLGEEDFEDAMAVDSDQVPAAKAIRSEDEYVVAQDEIIGKDSVAQQRERGDIDIPVADPQPFRKSPEPAAAEHTDDIDITLSDVDPESIRGGTKAVEPANRESGIDADTLDSPRLEPPPVVEDLIARPMPPMGGADLDATISLQKRSFLKLKKEDGGEETYLLGVEPLSIGRNHKNDIVLLDRSISRKHAEVKFESSGKYTLLDLSSGGGIYINGERVKQSALKNGDEIIIGDFHLKFVEES